MTKITLTPDQIHAGVTFRAPHTTLGDQLCVEVHRNLDLIEIYVRLPYEANANANQRANPRVCTGPAIAFLKRDIVEAMVAAVRGDFPAMIKSLQMLRDNQ